MGPMCGSEPFYHPLPAELGAQWRRTMFVSSKGRPAVFIFDKVYVTVGEPTCSWYNLYCGGVPYYFYFPEYGERSGGPWVLLCLN